MECKSVHHAPHVLVREIFMAVLFRALCRIMRETKWRAGEQLHHIHRLYRFPLRLPLLRRTGSAADPECVRVCVSVCLCACVCV